MNSVHTKLDEARGQLLDLGLRNRLINYKPRRAREVEVVDASPPDVYRALVQEDRAMSFLPRPEPENQLQLVGNIETEENQPQRNNNRLQTGYPSAELKKRLLNTYYAARTAIEEQGVNTLYLALGMLQWYESESSEIPHKAPLVLIPVAIDRANVRAQFRIRYTGEDIGTNLSLQEKLKSEFGIQFPDFPETDNLEAFNIQDYYECVKIAIDRDEFTQWEVDEFTIALGFFSFAKFLMYCDLNPANWSGGNLSQHSILQAVLGESPFQDSDNFLPDDIQIDEYLQPGEFHHVVDADSSQSLAIHDVSQGRNLLIQGPPGTGKSQTITNLIAEAIVTGKRVLFVAEKMAALEVVKSNLDKVDLGNACLELHSHKMKKQEIYRELKRTYELDEPPVADIRQELRHLVFNRDRLNCYCESVNTPIGESGTTPYQAYGRLLAAQRNFSVEDFPAINSLQLPRSESDFAQGRERTRELQALLRDTGPPRHNPFWGSQCLDFLSRTLVEQTVATARIAVMSLQDSSGQLACHLNLRVPECCETVVGLLNAARHTLSGGARQLQGVVVNATEWLTQNEELATGLRAGEKLSQLYREYESLLNRNSSNLFNETWLQGVHALRDALDDLKHSSTQLADNLGLPRAQNVIEVDSMIFAARYVLTNEVPQLQGIKVEAAEWQRRSEELVTGLNAGARLRQLHQEYDDILIHEAWRQNVLEVRKALVIYGSRWWRFLSGKYRRARNELTSLCVRPLSKSLDDRLRIVDAIRESQEQQSYLENIQEIGQHLFHTHWQGEYSDWVQLQKITQYLSALHHKVEHDELPGELIDYLATAPDLQILGEMVSTIEAHRDQYDITIRHFEERMQLPNSLEFQDRVVNTILEVKQVFDTLSNMQRNLDPIHDLRNQLFDTHWIENISSWEQLQVIMEYLLVLHGSGDMEKLPDELRDYLTSDSDFERLQSTISAVDTEHRVRNMIIEIKQIIDAIVESRRDFEEIQEVGQNLFSVHWRGESSNWCQLQSVARYLSELHLRVERSELPEQLIDYLSNPDFEELARLIADVEERSTSHSHALLDIIETIQLDQTIRFNHDGELIRLPFIGQTEILEHWDSEVQRFHDIVAYNNLVEALRLSGFGEVVRIANDWEDAYQSLLHLLEHAWYSALLDTVVRERPILGNLLRGNHQRILEQFSELDRFSLRCNEVVAHQHWLFLHQHESTGGHSEEWRVLLREFERRPRSRHFLSIRDLMSETGNVVQAIKPIFMMSPLSVAKFLPPESVHFDWVVFDEASQIKPIDAFGAIIRGRQVVVVGDDRQLPPTSFFDRLVAADENDQENVTGDMESILDLFRAQQAPRRMLRWHYRSRHESLITVSNSEFYENKLQLFPSPDAAREDVGLIFHHLPDTVYDRGRSGRNQQEARIVAEKVMDHARSRSNDTLGVATFSSSQMEAVQNELEILRRTDLSCEESFFNRHPEEPFFIKNLENVQGDERDFIFISIGYGRDAERRLMMNFGPLNQDGGERRLNVLITRARRRCEVFTNLTAEDIDLSRTNAHGVKALKRYLQYAERGTLDMQLPTGSEPDSPFEEAVAVALIERGFEVDYQIGSSGYFIDLGVKDPQRQGRYLLGIECDGATYHSARSARDRDRLRQQQLENLGWSIHRIWSTDWFRNPNRELARVVEAIEQARAQSVRADPFF